MNVSNSKLGSLKILYKMPVKITNFENSFFETSFSNLNLPSCSFEIFDFYKIVNFFTKKRYAFFIKMKFIVHSSKKLFFKGKKKKSYGNKIL